MIEHGGGVHAARQRHGGDAGDWLDLSTGINPVPYPVPGISTRAWARLPDADAEQRAAEAARRFYAAGGQSRVVCAPGSQALIQALPLTRPRGSRVGIAGFTYAEHAGCWSAAGHAVETVDDLDAASRALDVLVVVQPNNPDGRVLDAGGLWELSARLARRGGLLVVDEAFAEVAPGSSLAARAGAPGLCVLRSFGKFFGLAGARLGFALCDEDLAGVLRARLGPWAVSGPTLEVAATALADDAWAAATRRRLGRDAGALRALLAEHGLAPVGGTDLFVLAGHEDAGAVHEALCRQHVLTRAFRARPQWLRFGLPPHDGALARLAAALDEALNRQSATR